MYRIRLGNAIAEGKDHKDWFTGYFVENNSPLKTNDLEIKWSRHKKGEKKDHPGINATAKTIDILISGKLRFIFPDLRKEVILEKESDYIWFDAGVAHIWEALENSVSVVVRWPSIPGDQE